MGNETSIISTSNFYITLLESIPIITTSYNFHYFYFTGKKQSKRR